MTTRLPAADMCSEPKGAAWDQICDQVPSLSSYTRATGSCESSAAKAMRLPVVEMAALLKRLLLEICRVCSTFSHLRTRRTHLDSDLMDISGNFAPYKAVEQRT